MKKIISANDLNSWADTKDCQISLPTLIRKLIRATVNELDLLTIPEEDNTNLPGYDGIVNSKQRINTIPPGYSVWELGCSQQILSKINSDYKKRCDNPKGVTPAITTFVFVTPRIWTDSNQWILTHNKENIWKNIVILTAIELEEWINQHPNIALWLAEKLNKTKQYGVETIDQWWDKWSKGYQFTLPTSLILAGRENETNYIVEACQYNRSIYIESQSQKESIAFIIASFIQTNTVLREKALFVNTKEAFDLITKNYHNLIIITDVIELSTPITINNHTYIFAVSPSDNIRTTENDKNLIKLPTISRDGFVNGLIEAGFEREKAETISNETLRNISILRRRNEFGERNASWNNEKNILTLKKLSFINKWNESFEGDKEIVSSLMHKSYQEVKEELHNLLFIDDSPLANIYLYWRLKSPSDVYPYIKNRLTENDYTDIENILGLISNDTLENVQHPTKHILSLYSSSLKYSYQIKEGIYYMLILMGINGEQERANDMMVREFNRYTEKKLLFNHQFLPLIAEISPTAFLDFIEKDLRLEKPKTKILFETENHIELLWALETIARNKEHVFRVANILLNLCPFIDLENTNSQQTPLNSLKGIFRIISPETNLEYKQLFLEVLPQLIKRNPNYSFELAINILQDLSITYFIPHPKYKIRDFDTIHNAFYYPRIPKSIIQVVTNIMLSHSNFSILEIKRIIQVSTTKIMQCVRDEILESIKQNSQHIKGDLSIQELLIQEINRHKSYKTARWALQEEEIKKYNELLNYIEPTDTWIKNKYLFEHNNYFYHNVDYKTFVKTLKEKRANILELCLQEKGDDFIWTMINEVTNPEHIASSLIKVHSDNDYQEIIERSIKDEIPLNFVKSYFNHLFHAVNDIEKYWNKYINWALLNRTEYASLIAIAPGYNDDMANRIQNTPIIKHDYWGHVNFNHTEIVLKKMVVEELLKVQRYVDLLELIYDWEDLTVITDQTTIEILRGVIEHISTSHDDHSITCHYISKILSRLSKSEDESILNELILGEIEIFKYIYHYYDLNKLIFVKRMLSDPAFMMQLIIVNEGIDEGFHQENEKKIFTNKLTNRQVRAIEHIFLHFSDIVLTFDGTIENQGVKLRNYISKLLQLGEKHHYTRSTYSIIGKLLGKIPRDSFYPPRYLCEIIEELDNSYVDSAYESSLFNHEGVTVRGCYDGGIIERKKIESFEQYKQNSGAYFPRINKIFDNIIRYYKREAKSMDEDALLADMRW